MKVELQQLTIDVLKYTQKFLTKKNALRIEPKQTFRMPTKKEMGKHQKLISKQRNRYGY